MLTSKPIQRIQREDWPQIAELVKTKTLSQIGNDYGVSRERIRQVLRMMNVPTPKRRFTYPCLTDECPRKVILSLPTGRKYCNACRAYTQNHLKKPGMMRITRHFQMKICIDCNERRARSKERCGRCNARIYTKTDKYKKWVKQYVARNRERLNQYQRDYKKRLKEAR